ncbi:MAG: hypothetical protein FWH26_09380 [Oscillospiraceae bacterium]|nr:hypothetical protein [Oscillospiraceae bacterium]
MKRFVNTSGKELVIYADSKLTNKVGMLYRDSACFCIHEQDAAVVVLYKVSSNGVFKVGFTDFIGGVQEG